MLAAIQGTCSRAFAPVRAALARTFDQGLEVGAAVAVTVDGQLVVDLWGGFADEAQTVPWARDTRTNVWSTTKTMTALCALILADQGELDLHAPVARYWPEFAAAGKGGIAVRHLLGPTAGLSGWQEPISAETLYDWEQATALLAAQAPWWAPGTASGYHAITQGYLVGEVIRRVPGQSVGQFFASEVAAPLGADFHLGLAPAQFGRVANVIPPPPLAVGEVDPNSIAMRTLANPPLDARWAWTEPWRRAEIPAANGHGNARSVARVQAILACGGRWAASASSPRRAVRPCSSSRRMVSIWYWAHRCGSAWASGSAATSSAWDPASVPASGAAGGLADRRRPRRPHDGGLRDEPHGRGHVGRRTRRGHRHGCLRCARRLAGGSRRRMPPETPLPALAKRELDR